jgi:hypothetical protein
MCVKCAEVVTHFQGPHRRHERLGRQVLLTVMLRKELHGFEGNKSESRWCVTEKTGNGEVKHVEVGLRIPKIATFCMSMCA